jgi:hypothetical protein
MRGIDRPKGAAMTRQSENAVAILPEMRLADPAAKLGKLLQLIGKAAWFSGVVAVGAALYALLWSCVWP